jgi:RNA polymerase sigma-70 factor (ECF subfamily)
MVDAPVSLEHETVRRAAEGDRRAQSWLARRLVGKVRKVSRALAASAADADDAAQLAIMEILRSVRTYRGESSLDHWAGRIAVRTTLRFLARERRKSEPMVGDAEAYGMTPSMSHGMAEDLPRDVREYLELLPELQRTAIVLHHALGYSLDEVAELTAVSRNTVKGRLRLGTAALRKVVRREQKIGAARGGGQS